MNRKKIVAIVLFIFLGLFIFTFANRGVTPLQEEKPKTDETITTPDEKENNGENENDDEDQTPVVRPTNPTTNNPNPSPIVNDEEEETESELELLKDEFIKLLEDYKKEEINSYTTQNQNNAKDIKTDGKNNILNAINIEDARKFLEEAKEKIDALDLTPPSVVKLNVNDELETPITENSIIGSADIYLEANDDSEFTVYINGKIASHVNTKTTVGGKQIFKIESKILLEHGLNVLTLVDQLENETKVEFNVDIKAPEAILTFSNNNGAAVTKDDVIVTMVTDEVILPLEDWVKVDDYTYTKVITENGKYSVEISDLYGNKTTINYEVKRIDRINPVITNVTEGGKYNNDVTYGIIEQSIAEIIINGNVYNEKNAQRTLTEDGIYTIKVIDKAGNFAEVTFTIDKTAPTVSLEALNCNYYDNNACYHNAAVTIKVTAEDINGPLEYSYGDSNTWVLSDTFVREWTSENFKVRVRDSFGNVKEETISINIRKDIPNLEFRMNNNLVTTNQVAKGFPQIELKLSSYTKILEYGALIRNNNEEVTILDIKNSENLKTFKPGMGQILDKVTLGSVDGEYTIWFYYKDFYGNINLVSSPKFIIDNEIPVISVKEESIGSIADKTFKKVSFKLYDNYKVKEVELNGVLKGLTPNKWSDFNNITVGSNGAVYGENTLVLRDLAGNEATYTFILDNVAPVVYLNNNLTLNLKFGETYNEYGAYAIDEVDGRVELPNPSLINYYSCDKNLENCILAESRVSAVDTTRAGLYKVAYTYKDKAGNDSNVKVRLVYVNYIDPVKFNHLSYTTDTSTKVWGHDATVNNPTYKAVVKFTIANKDNASELKYIWSNKRIHNELKVNPENYDLLDIPSTPDSKGYYSIEYMPNIDGKMILHLYSKDKAGNVVVWGGYDSYFKKSVPSITSVDFGNYLLGTLTNQNITATLNVNSYFDISEYQVSYNDNDWQNFDTNKLVISDNSVKTVKFRVKDVKGTFSAETINYIINLDTINPLTTNITYAFGTEGLDLTTLKVRIYTNESILTPTGYTKVDNQTYKTEYKLTVKDWLKGTFKKDIVITDLAGNETVVPLEVELKWPL